MANIEDVHKRLYELMNELIKLSVTGILDQSTESKQDDAIAILQNIETSTGANNVIPSAGNTSIVPLADGVTFTGVAELTARTDVMVVAKTDQNGVLYVEFSPDGTNWDTSLSFQYNTARINAPHIFETGNRYVRVRFENNSGSAQTYLRLNTYFGNTMSPLTAPINGLLAENYDATVVRPTDYKYEVAMGKRQGRATINKWGHNEAIATGAAQLVAPWGGAFNPNTDIIKVAQTFTVTYTNTTDGAGQTGATMVQVDYLDANFELQTGIHVLGSSGSDTTSFSGLGINRVVVIGNGGTGWNENKITFTATTDGTTQAEIPALLSVTQQLMYHTPINHNLLADDLYGNVLKTSGGQVPKVETYLYSWSRVVTTRFEVYHDKIDTGVENHFRFDGNQPFVIGGREVLYAMVGSDKAGTELEIRMSGILERIS